MALAVVLVVLGAVAFVGVRYATREKPKAQTVEGALDRLHRSSTTVAGGDDLPEPGVYAADGAGREAISFPPNSQDDGAVLPVSVEHLGSDCFRFRVDYNQAHWHQWDLCRGDGGSLEMSVQRNFQRWDFGSLVVENTGEYRCDPPAVWMPPGAAAGTADGTVTRDTCTGSNTAAPGASTSSDRTEVVGRTTLRIGGERVAAVHVRQRTELAGAQTGLNQVELWFDARTGLPLRFERNYRVDTDSPVGTITYTEEGEWQLQSTTPKQ